MKDSGLLSNTEAPNMSTEMTSSIPKDLNNPRLIINDFMKKRLAEFMGPDGIGTFAINAASAIYALRNVAGKVTQLLHDMILKLAGLGVEISAALIDQLLKHPVRSVVILTALATLFALHGPIVVAMLEAAGFGELGPIAGSMAAGVQSTMYGGAVPAGGVFAFLQYLGMVLA